MKKLPLAYSRGVSRSIDFLRSSLITPNRSDKTAKPGAVVDLSELVQVAVDQTAAGDSECGYFVAELLAYLWKKRSYLSDHNEIFRECYLKWESSRLSTKRGSPLRSLIHRILVEAHRERRFQELVAQMPDAALLVERNTTLLELPEFNADPKVVSEWTDKIVYPKLRAMQLKLAEDPIIGHLKKALDENGKFQISRLKPLIRQTVGRVAMLPKTYYFDIS
jgi:hypothetical protein